MLKSTYKPDPAFAHESVRNAITSGSTGKFIRSFHYLQAIGRAIETWRLRRIMSALRAVDKKGAVLIERGSVRPAGVEIYEAKD